MKRLTHLLLIILLLASCRKPYVAPADQLPPATREGNLTFGCLVNGKPYTPSKQGLSFGSPTLSSFYQHLNTSTAQGYYFNVAAKRKNKENTEGISLHTEGLAIQQEGKYTLRNFPNDGEAFATYGINTGGSINEYATEGPFQGELHITRFDEAKSIVSGTFWFDAVNDRGEKVEVREGRFDMLFSR
jgi:hypothetical protein